VRPDAVKGIRYFVANLEGVLLDTAILRGATMMSFPETTGGEEAALRSERV